MGFDQGQQKLTVAENQTYTILTVNGIFDCIGKVEVVCYDENIAWESQYIIVLVEHYLGNQWSSKLQRYYFHEIKRLMLHGSDTAHILYGNTYEDRWSDTIRW